MSFVCATLICVQQFLGIGYSTGQTGGTFLYSDYSRNYFCQTQNVIAQGKSATFYRCDAAPQSRD
jgi:hypothetical protein